MFVRQKRNKSGRVSVQVIDKSDGYRVVKAIGAAGEPGRIERLVELGNAFIERQSQQYSLFPRDEHDNAVVLDFVRTLQNALIRTVGPELIFGRLFDAQAQEIAYLRPAVARASWLTLDWSLPKKINDINCHGYRPKRHM